MRASAVVVRTTTSATMSPKDKQFLSPAVVDASQAQMDLEPDPFHVLELQELLTSSSASAAPATKAAASVLKEAATRMDGYSNGFCVFTHEFEICFWNLFTVFKKKRSFCFKQVASRVLGFRCICIGPTYRRLEATS